MNFLLSFFHQSTVLSSHTEDVIKCNIRKHSTDRQTGITGDRDRQTKTHSNWQK